VFIATSHRRYTGSRKSYLLPLAAGVSEPAGKGLSSGVVVFICALSGLGLGGAAAASELVAVAGAALPEGSWAVGIADGTSGEGIKIGSASMTGAAWELSSAACCLSNAAAAKATKNKASILIK